MTVVLARAGLEDARDIWQMQLLAFQSLLEKYRDYDTNPGAEPLERVQARLAQLFTCYYRILADGEIAGAIRVVDFGEPDRRKRISPLFILPQYRNRGIAQSAIQEAERIHGSHGWELDTIAQETGNCHLYEKMGYVPTGATQRINEQMTLIVYRKD